MDRNSGSKKIGFWLSSSLVLGNMTGSGIFLLPASLAVYGGITIFGWLFTTMGAIILALLFTRLSRLIKKAGGPYVFAREGFGDFAGFMVAWGYWISIWSGNAAISVAGVGYLSEFFPSIKENNLLSAAIAIGAIWIFTWVNTQNIRSVGVVQLITTILKILPLLFIGTVGFIYFDRSNFSPFNLSGSSGFTAITASAALTLWAFMGLESATIPSDKIRDPGRTIPRATIFGTLVAALIYISSTVSVMGLISPADLQDSSAPFADAAGKILGSEASALVALGAVISCFGALNGWILLQGQIPMAAARDNIFPGRFANISSRGVPLFGVIFSSILASILVSMNYTRGLVGMFTFTIMLSTLTVLLPYLLSSLSEIMIIVKGRNKDVATGLTRALLIGVPAFLYSLWAVTGLGIEIIAWGLVLLATGIPFYLFKKKKY
ncbi:MAG TPA: amino acid permease [Bacteroidales bacterium]|nr:amino acid permease [Bacteroidales bacterium]